MRICFISRRFFPAISGMSVYAANLLRELVAGGHDVVMISQYRNDPAGSAVYGGGPPPAVPGVKVIGLESLGEQEVGHGRPADFEADLAAMVEAAESEHAVKPFDLVHAQYGYPCGLAALEVSRRLGIPNVVSIQGGDGHWVGTC
jgi:glycogen synthase